MSSHSSPEDSSSSNNYRPHWVPLVAVFLATIAVAAWWLTRSWHSSLLDHFEFRQLQTALSIYWMKQEGLQLDYLTPLFGPPWSIPFEFPFYQWCVTLLLQVTDMNIEPASRLVSLMFFAATLPAIYGLAGLAGLSPSRRLIVIGVVVLTPIYLFYPRTAMIETTALCFGVWFLYALHRTLESRARSWLIATITFAVLAALIKITTFVVYCMPAGLLTAAALWRASDGGRHFKRTGTLRLALFSALPVLLAVAAALAWIAYGDSLKSENPFTTYLTSHSLRGWNYGSWALRFEPNFWIQFWKNITQNLLGEGALALIVIGATFATPLARRMALVYLAGFLCGPLIFANLYHIHDYYYVANALLLSGAAGVVLASAWDNPRLRPASRWALLLFFLFLQCRSFDRGYRQYYGNQTPLPDLAFILRETVPPDDVVLIAGADWLPLIPYYSQRRAIMLTEGRNLDTSLLNTLLTRLPPRRIAALAVVGEWRKHLEWIRERTSYLGLAPQPFAISEDTDLYLAVDAIKPGITRLRQHHFTNARVLFSDTNLEMTASQEQQLPAHDFIMCVPAPSRSRSQFGISVGTIESQPVIFTHAPSELYFSPPPGTHRLAATFGLIPEAYARPLPEASDGVIVEIFEQQADGLRHSLLRRELNPATRPEDRGPQEINFENTEPFTGELVFVISPGLAGNVAYDQAYWSRIEIR